MSSESGYSSNNKRDDNYRGQRGWQYSSSYRYESPQPRHEGMTTHPSVGRFMGPARAAPMFEKKPATPTLKDFLSPARSGVIVDLKAAQGPNSSKGKK